MSAFDTVPPDVDEITNWRDFRFKDRAIDYTLLRGDAMLELSEYDTRGTGTGTGVPFDAGGNDKVLTVPAGHVLAPRLRVDSRGDWECTAYMIRKMDPLLRRENVERCVPTLAGRIRGNNAEAASAPASGTATGDTAAAAAPPTPRSPQPQYHEGQAGSGGDGDWSPHTFLTRNEWELLARLGTTARGQSSGDTPTDPHYWCPPEGHDLVSVLGLLGVRVAVGSVELGADAAGSPRKERRKRHQVRGLLPPHATMLHKGRALESDGNHRLHTYESRSHYYAFFYWTS